MIDYVGPQQINRLSCKRIVAVGSAENSEVIGVFVTVEPVWDWPAVIHQIATFRKDIQIGRVDHNASPVQKIEGI